MGDAPPSHPAYGLLRPVTAFASVLLAGNPSPMTLEGTNTWLLRAAGSPHCVVVDPGPDDEEHLRRVAGHGPVPHVLLTHGHPDHAGGARSWPRDALRVRQDREPDPRQVVEIVYADVDPVLWPAADASVVAQLQYLRGD